MCTVHPLDTLRTAIVANGGKPEDLELISNQGVAEAVAKTIVSYAALFRDLYVVTVDYRLSFEQMLAECGCDNNPNITAVNFSITGESTEDEGIILLHLHFNRRISTEVAIEEMQKLGLEPARLEHALAFGKKFPDKQREFPIVFLGSTGLVYGVPYVPYLDMDASSRSLNLCYPGRGWSDHHRFAAIRRKESGQQQSSDPKEIAATEAQQ